MALTRAPFSPLHKNKAVGRSVVFYDWKTLHCARQYVIPYDPKTTSQVAQRASLAQAVSDFHAIFTSDVLNASWGVLVDDQSLPYSSFNARVKALMEAQSFTQPVSFPTSIEPRLNKTWRVRFLDTVTYDTGSEAGIFEYWQGPLSTGLVYVADRTLHAQGYLDLPNYVEPPTPEYWQLRKGNYRTGFVLLTDPAA